MTTPVNGVMTHWIQWK